MALPYDPRPQPVRPSAPAEPARPPAPAKPPAAIAPAPRAADAPAPRFAPPSDPARLRVQVEGSTVPRYGDRAGEHLAMWRGSYHAGLHVILAFLGQVVLIGGLLGVGAAEIASLLGGGPLSATVLLAVGLPTGGVGAWLTFRDRWRVIETFASRWCSGYMNLSILYVPAVALLYANVRAVQKLFGR